jgi:type II secretory pathway pseudopilin PulG
MPAHRSRAFRTGGFTYLGVLLAVALAGVALAAAATVWSTAAQREREAELLFVGDQYRRAIGSYFDASPGAKEYPRSLGDLLEDRRLPVVRRHLRRPFPDPMTGEADWGVVRSGDRIQGVYSRSGARPIKRAGFATADEAFAGAASYRDWRFVATPTGARGRTNTASGAAPGTRVASSGPSAAAEPIGNVHADRAGRTGEPGRGPP